MDRVSLPTHMAVVRCAAAALAGHCPCAGVAALLLASPTCTTAANGEEEADHRLNLPDSAGGSIVAPTDTCMGTAYRAVPRPRRRPSWPGRCPAARPTSPALPCRRRLAWPGGRRGWGSPESTGICRRWRGSRGVGRGEGRAGIGEDGGRRGLGETGRGSGRSRGRELRYFHNLGFSSCIRDANKMDDAMVSLPRR